VTGAIIESPLGYNGGFTVSACIALVGAALYIFNRYERLEIRPQDAKLYENKAAV
jgi:hypothetical protein